MSDQQFLFDVAEDVVLRDLGSLSPEPDYRSFVSNEDVQQMREIIQKQHLEMEALRRQVHEHNHFFVLMKARSVQCLSAFSKYKDVYMYKDGKSVLKLDDLLKEVNKLLPSHMKSMDRTELLEATRQLNEAQQLGLTWRKSNSDYACDGWTIKKQVQTGQSVNRSQMQKPGLLQIGSVNINTPPVVSVQQSTMSPINTPERASMSPRSPAPVITNRQ